MMSFQCKISIVVVFCAMVYMVAAVPTEQEANEEEEPGNNKPSPLFYYLGLRSGTQESKHWAGSKVRSFTHPYWWVFSPVVGNST